MHALNVIANSITQNAHQKFRPIKNVVQHSNLFKGSVKLCKIVKNAFIRNKLMIHTNGSHLFCRRISETRSHFDTARAVWVCDFFFSFWYLRNLLCRLVTGSFFLSIFSQPPWYRWNKMIWFPGLRTLKYIDIIAIGQR